MPRLKEWFFSTALGLFREPEVSGGHEFVQTRLFGRVYDDARRDMLTGEFDDGHRVITSPVHEINWQERYVKTRSGTKYELEGNPSESYIDWLKKEGLWDKYSAELLPHSTQLN